MVLSDYRKDVLPGDSRAKLIAAARTDGGRVLVAPKRGNHARYAGADLIMPDVEELAEATGLPTGTEAEIAAAAASLRRAHSFGAVMVIRGEQGVTLVEGDADSDTVQHMPSDLAELVDPSGAGDAVVAVAAAGLAAGLPLAVIARLGALAAGIVLGKTGIAVVREDEFLEVLTPGRLASRKLATRSEAAERVERWRRAGCRVGFLVGGGAESAPEAVAQARAWCDRLVVGLGDADPAAAVLAEMPGVDLIARFGGDTPLELIRLLRPDVLVQDPGRSLFSVSGGDLVQEWGGTVRSTVPAAEPTAA